VILSIPAAAAAERETLQTTGTHFESGYVKVNTVETKTAALNALTV